MTRKLGPMSDEARERLNLRAIEVSTRTALADAAHDGLSGDIRVAAGELLREAQARTTSDAIRREAQRLEREFVSAWEERGQT